TDDIFWMDVRRGEEMARQIKKAGIRKFFTVQTRTDIIVKFPHLIEMWKECGKLAIFLGLESVTDEGLAAVNKKNKACNNVKAIELLKEMGVGFTPNFIVDPAWDREDFTRLRDWISDMGAYNSGFSILTPLPGTDLWNTAKMDVTTYDWEMYDIVHAVLPTTLSLDDFYEEYSGLWRHALDVRYRYRGKWKTYLQLGAALATGKVSLHNVRRGLGMAKTFSKPETFLRAHE
ncbi:MAG: B12-binding domain-containing radical SAM protein, partial [bacterium]